MNKFILLIFSLSILFSQLRKVELPINEQLKLRSVYYDSHGFLWIGGDNGLYRYDGYSLKIFNKNLSPYSISDNFIWDIQEGSDGNLYIATESGGLNVYNKKQERFFHFKQNKTNGPSYNSINQILVDTVRDGLWLATYGGGLDFFDIKERSFRNYEMPEELNENKKSIYIRSLAFDQKGNIWLATKDGAIAFDPEKKVFIQKIEAGHSIISIVYFKNKLYLGGWGSGLKIYDLNYKKLRVDKIEELSSRIPKIWALSLQDSSTLLIGSIDDGLVKMNLDNYKYELIKDKKLKSIWAISRSAPDRTLLASSTGLYEFKEKKEPKLININYAYSIFKKNDSILYLGTNKGLRVLNTKQEKMIHNYAGDQNELYSIYKDRNNNFLFGKKDGLRVINSVTGKEIRTKSITNIQSSVYEITEDDNRNLLIASSSGLYILNSDYKAILHFSERDTLMKISGDIVSDILVDYDKNIWAGTDSKGLNKINYNKSGEFNCKTIEQFKNMVITDLFLDKDSLLWVASHGNGLFYKDSNSDKFISIENDELKNLTFYEMVEDNQNRLWLSSVYGVYIYNKLTKKYILIKSNELGVIFNIDHGMFIDKNGKLYINGYDKLLIFNTSSYGISNNEFPFRFTSFKLFNKEVKTSENSVLKKSISFTDQIHLNHDQNIFSISFAALKNENNKDIYYLHKLEGFDKDWVLSTDNTVTYTNLNSGKYVLKVKVAENPSLFPETSHKLTIVVSPPFYLTWYAYCFYISLIFLIYFLRVRSIQKRNRELERLVMQRTFELRELNQNLEKIVENKTHELQDTNRSLEGEIVVRKSTEKALEKRSEELKRLFNYVEEVREDERKNLSREVHDELGQILTALKMDTKWIEKKADANLTVIKKSKSMITLIDNAVLAVQRICSALRPNILDELGLIAAIEWQLSDFKERSGIDCRLNIIDESNFKLEPNSAIPIFRVFQETLTNVLRHSQATVFEVSITMKENTFKLEMTDNGIGLDDNELSSPKSLGLLGMKERISEIGGIISMKGEKGKGTTIYIELVKK
jgi:signal transduction histidine kinase/ligand-binding sensor domain-containing protein